MRSLFAILIISFTILQLHAQITEAAPGLESSHNVSISTWSSISSFATERPVRTFLPRNESVEYKPNISRGRTAFTTIASCCMILISILLGMPHSH